MRGHHRDEPLAEGFGRRVEPATNPVGGRPCLGDGAGPCVDLQRDRLHAPAPQRQQVVGIPPSRLRHVDIRGFEVRADAAVDVDHHQVARHHEPVAADGLDHRDACAVGGAFRPAELHVAVQQPPLLTGPQVEHGDAGSVPRVLARSVGGHRHRVARAAPRCLPHVAVLGRDSTRDTGDDVDRPRATAAPRPRHRRIPPGGPTTVPTPYRPASRNRARPPVRRRRPRSPPGSGAVRGPCMPLDDAGQCRQQPGFGGRIGAEQVDLVHPGDRTIGPEAQRRAAAGTSAVPHPRSAHR